MLERQLKKHQRTASVFFVLCSIAVTAAALNYLKLSSLPLRNFSLHQDDILELIMSLSVMTLFIEQAVETILVPIRTPDRQQIEHEIETLRVDLAGGPDADLLRRLKNKEHELAVYRLKTARYAYWLSYALGIAVSVVGIRALSGLIDIEKLSDRALQNTLFGLVDVIITGSVIAGGSAAIDKMGRKISETLNLRSATASTARTASSGNPAPEQPVTSATN